VCVCVLGGGGGGGGGVGVCEFKSQNAGVIHVLIASTTGLLNLAHSLIADSFV
jgi:hypothetical protein